MGFPRIIWTEKMDQTITDGHLAAKSNREIGVELGVAACTIAQRSKHLLSPSLATGAAPSEKTTKIVSHDFLGRDSWPLPPGHSISWNALVAGTWLENKPFEKCLQTP